MPYKDPEQARAQKRRDYTKHREARLNKKREYYQLNAANLRKKRMRRYYAEIWKKSLGLIKPL